MTKDMAIQIEKLPIDTTHLIVSVGGNDALNSMGLLDVKVKSVAEVLGLMATVIAEFRQRYRTMLEAMLYLRHRTALSTIYYTRLPEADLQQLAVTALAFFNDLIISEAIRHRLPLLDLRFICDEDSDFANPIEPSSAGSAKIAAAIMRLLLEHDFAEGHTEVYV